MIISVTLCGLLPCAEVSAKKRCQPLLTKLQNVQALQRQGHSAKRSQSLRLREEKARDNWWQCENSSRQYKKKTRTKKSEKSDVASYQTKLSARSKKEIKAGTPFKTSQAIVITSKYQGKKKQAWLAYYQQPERCLRPKTLQVFAFCSEDKHSQRLAFDKLYHSEANSE